MAARRIVVIVAGAALAGATSVVYAASVTVTAPKITAVTRAVAPATPKLHVSVIIGSAARNGSSGKYHATVTVTVVNQAGTAVSGATVTGSWTAPSINNCGSTTDASGQCTVTTGNNDFTNGTTQTWSIVNITFGVYAYDSAANAKSSIDVFCPSSGSCTP